MVLCLFGLLLLWGFSRRREKQGRLLVTAGILWMAFFGMDPVAKALMGPLEDPFRQLSPLLLKKVSRSRSSLSSWLAVTERILSYQSQAIFGLQPSIGSSKAFSCTGRSRKANWSSQEVLFPMGKGV